MIRNTCSTISGASPSEGSSRSSSRGALMSARAMASICCSPPESVPAAWPNRSRSRGKSSSIRSMSRSASAAGRPMPPSTRFSRTDNRPNTRRPSGHCEMPRPTIRSVDAPRDVLSVEADGTRAWPHEARDVLSRVDLPAPLEPMSATVSPWRDMKRVASIDRADAAVGDTQAIDGQHRGPVRSGASAVTGASPAPGRRR